MSDLDTSKKSYKFSSFKLLIPFGRYRLDKERSSDNSAAYVGREGHRAFLIEALNGGSKRGAYLVTGRRGVGKTTFVESCVEEYQNAIFRRFLRSNYGRSIVDLLTMLGLALLTISMLVVLSNSLEILVIAQKTNSILWIPIIIISLIVSTPLFFAIKIIGTITKHYIRKRFQFFAAVSIFLCIAAIYYLPPFGAPTESSAKILLSIGMLITLSLSPLCYEKKPRGGIKSIFKILLTIGIAISLSFYFSGYIITNNSIKYPIMMAILSLVVVISSLIIYILRRKKSNVQVIDYVQKTTNTKHLEVVGAIFITAISLLYFFNKVEYIFLTILLFSIALPLIFFLKILTEAYIKSSEAKEKETFKFTPPVDALLLTKAFFLCMISLQLLYPIVGADLEFFKSHINFDNKENIENLNRHSSSDRKWIRSSVRLGVISKESTDNEEYFTLFPSSSSEESLWLFFVTIIIIILHYLEYEWICRPFIAQRQTNTLDHGPRLDSGIHHEIDVSWQEDSQATSNIQKSQERSQSYFREIEKLTYPYLLCSFWMPSIVARINLGFDSLDHKGVIHSMLYGLKQEYEKKLLSWKSPYHILIQLISFVFLVTICSKIGYSYLDFPEINLQEKYDVKSIFSQNKKIRYCTIINKGDVNSKNGSLIKTMCLSNPAIAEAIIPVFYATLLRIKVSRSVYNTENPHFIFKLLHYNIGPIEIDSNNKMQQDKSLNLRLYHALTFLLLMWVSRKLSRKFSILPYRKTINEINTIIESLNLRKTELRKSGRWTSENFINKAFGREVESEFSRNEIDSRTIELSFLNLLENMQDKSIEIPFLPSSQLSIPTPEIHFIFDELDKITGMVGTQVISPEQHESEHSLLQDERRRAFALHRLLSDMKRIISSAPARFIFVGSRMLHDEWMADQGRRQPLLSSIFDAEIYLPSLMLDHPQSATSKKDMPETPSKLTFRIEEYFLRTHHSAQKSYRQSLETRFAPFFALSDQQKHKASFYETRYDQSLYKKLREEITIIEVNPSLALKKLKIPNVQNPYQGTLIDEFINFLTYRSAGTPKKIDEILSSFVRPSARFSHAGTKNRYEALPSRDVLSFTERETYRIQLIDSLLKHLINKFEDILSSRDDKVSVNIIYLFDFLMKFHQRAFSWKSLDRIDELSHMHRAPDIRKLFEKVVDESTEKYLHKIFHGLYDFRFRSEFSAEIKYLSRRSKPEMAAFNFTLDESQELKAIYAAILDTPGHSNVEVIEALGELYEYDQAYETARGYYEKAIMLHDEKFIRYMGETVDVEDRIYDEFIKTADALHPSRHPSSNKEEFIDPRRLAMLLTNINSPERVPLIKAIMMHDQEAVKNTTYYVPWIIRRIRLMLQIGLTFELELDFERALAHYQSTYWLTRAITDVAFPAEKEGENLRWIVNFFKNAAGLLIQPIFSEAWIAEKMDSSLDSSISMVELYLIDMRRRIDFLKDPSATNNNKLSRFLDNRGNHAYRGSVTHANFAIIGADLHNKAGDLYFFKGRGTGLYGEDIVYPQQKKSGYLLKAHYHYAVALHEIRRFIFHKHYSSGVKFDVTDNKTPEKTIEMGLFSNQERQSIAYKFLDFSEVTIARMSFNYLINEKYQERYVPKRMRTAITNDTLSNINKALDDWFYTSDSDLNRNFHNNKDQKNYSLTAHLTKQLGYWYFRQNSLREPNIKIVGFDKFDNSLYTFSILVFSSIYSVESLFNAGLYTSAINEIQTILNTLSRYLKWIRIHITVHELPKPKNENILATFTKILTQIMELLLEKHHSYHAKSNQKNQAIDDSIKTSFIICDVINTLSFLGKYFNETEEVNIKNYLENFMGELQNNHLLKYHPNWASYSNDERLCLSSLIKRYKYPALVNLSMLKSLLDHTILASLEEGKTSINENIQITEWFEELCEVEKKFDSPMLFTPFMLAETSFLIWHYKEKYNKFIGEPSEGYKNLAYIQTIRAEQMFTHGREYYRTISKMYYLFDDFNDRALHANHAMQMAGADLLALFKQRLA